MKAITLEEAFREGLVKKGDYIDYQPTSATCMFDTSQTGWEKVQTFSTEQLGWQLDEFEGKLILLADKPTEQLLTLKGKIGYERGVETQHELCKKLYTNSSLASDVISMTSEIQEVTKLILKGRYYHWLASSCVYAGKGIEFWYVRLVNSGYVRSGQLWYSNLGSYSYSYGVRPVVYLKSNIQITNVEQGDGSESNPWKIAPVDLKQTEMLSSNKLELMQLIQNGEQRIKEAEEQLAKAKELLEKM